MNLSDGIDFSRDDVALALIDYANKNGANVSGGASDVVVIKTGSKLRNEGVFIVLKANSDKEQ